MAAPAGNAQPLPTPPPYTPNAAPAQPYVPQAPSGDAGQFPPGMPQAAMQQFAQPIHSGMPQHYSAIPPPMQQSQKPNPHALIDENRTVIVIVALAAFTLLFIFQIITLAIVGNTHQRIWGQ